MTIAHPSGDRHWTRTKPERVLRGAAAPGAKLSPFEIAALYAAYDQGVNKSELARQYGVARITVWRHIKARERNTR